MKRNRSFEKFTKRRGVEDEYSRMEACAVLSSQGGGLRRVDG